MKMKPKCPHLITKLICDECWDRCELQGRICTKEYTGQPCEEYEYWLKEENNGKNIGLT